MSDIKFTPKYTELVIFLVTTKDTIRSFSEHDFSFQYTIETDTDEYLHSLIKIAIDINCEASLNIKLSNFIPKFMINEIPFFVKDKDIDVVGLGLELARSDQDNADFYKRTCDDYVKITSSNSYRTDAVYVAGVDLFKRVNNTQVITDDNLQYIDTSNMSTDSDEDEAFIDQVTTSFIYDYEETHPIINKVDNNESQQLLKMKNSIELILENMRQLSQIVHDCSCSSNSNEMMIVQRKVVSWLRDANRFRLENSIIHISAVLKRT